MLDITKLNTKLTELYDQDTTFIDQIHDLYMRANESTRKIELLDAMITDQRDVMDVQARKIRELTTEKPGSDTRDITDNEPEVDIDVSKEVAAKTISWANYGWHTSFVGPDGVHYKWLRG